jgi:hypothetical protein
MSILAVVFPIYHQAITPAQEYDIIAGERPTVAKAGVYAVSFTKVA